MAPAIVLAAALFHGGPLGAVDLASDVRTESRVRLIDEEDGADLIGRDRELLEVGVEPRLVLTNDARLRLGLSYAPSLRIPYESLPSDPGPDGATFEDDRITFQHNLLLTASRDITDWNLRGAASATYGFYDPLDREQAAEGQPLLSTSRLPFQGYMLTAGFTARTWARTHLSVDATASTSGGDGPAARARLPTNTELRLANVLHHDASPRDDYELLLTLAATNIEDGDEAQTLEAGGRWTRGLTPQQALRVGGGLALALLQGEAGSHERAGPWAEASWAYAPAPHLPGLVLTVGGAPAVDRLTGSLSYRAHADARAGWAPFQDWRFELGAGAALLEPWLGFDDLDASSTWMGTVAARAEWAMTTRIRLGAGLASLWQDSGRPDLISFQEWVATVDLVTTLIR